MARQRRTAGQVQDDILVAAARTFAERGYSGTSTRAIAEEAGVAEPLIFRHFGSKAELFGAAAFADFTTFVSAFVAAFEAAHAATEGEGEPSLDYMGGLYDELRRSKPMIRMLLASSMVDPEIDDGMAAANGVLQGAFARLEELVVAAIEARGWHNEGRVDVPLAVRCAFGMAMSLAVVDDLVLPRDGEPLDRDRIVRELGQYLHHGTWGRFDPPARSRQGTAGATAAGATATGATATYATGARQARAKEPT